MVTFHQNLAQDIDLGAIFNSIVVETQECLKELIQLGEHEFKDPSDETTMQIACWTIYQRPGDDDDLYLERNSQVFKTFNEICNAFLSPHFGSIIHEYHTFCCTENESIMIHLNDESIQMIFHGYQL